MNIHRNKRVNEMYNRNSEGKQTNKCVVQRALCPNKAAAHACVTLAWQGTELSSCHNAERDNMACFLPPS